MRAGAYEAVYGNMPPHGLGRAGRLEDAVGQARSALGRLGRGDGTDQPLSPEGAPRDAA